MPEPVKQRRPVEISLNGLTAIGRHGVLEAERAGQPFVVDVRLRLPEPAGDVLRETVDYAAVAATVAAEIAGEPVALIETLARRIADRLLADHPRLVKVWVTVHKPQAPIDVAFADVTCKVSRGRREWPVLPFVLSLGGNLGDAQATLRAAVNELAATPGVAVDRVSDVYRTSPVEVTDVQPDYLNIVVTGATTLPPPELLARATAIERNCGRTRPHAHAPRTLDIDIVAMGDLALDTDALTLPHPRAMARAFVLVPWLELDPAARLPQGAVRDLVSKLDTGGVTRLHSLGL